MTILCLQLNPIAHVLHHIESGRYFAFAGCQIKVKPTSQDCSVKPNIDAIKLHPIAPPPLRKL
jgi:hypothetical protein